MLDNDTVEIHQIKDIKDDLEYYIENYRDPDFMENDMLYEDIDGLEEMLLDVGLNFLFIESQIILRSNVLRHHFYLPKVIILVQTGLEYSAG